ncbi:MAG: hypothetical protein J0J04_08215 [Microbacterium sp.]|uniref:hypothetical protein n=1 Tax=Microbacterium sp. TaxID=51671 RepID=UPI001AC7721B|nr:hypothetical protein [Microbacterium sp.]MBN9214785.1 hypothetical protein [Microbacterium sp.]
MDTTAAEQIARRAHAFIARVSAVLTDEPEFADTKIPALFAEHGAELNADAAALTQD